MGMAGLGMMMVGTGFSMFSKIDAGNMQKRMFDRNAKFAEMQAEDAIHRGEYAETIQRRSTKRTIGTQRVSLAAQNVDVNLGSSSDVQENTAYLGELDALTIRSNAAKEAWVHRISAIDASLHGDLAKTAGFTGAMETLLGGMSQGALAYGYMNGKRVVPTNGPQTTPTPSTTEGVNWPEI